MWGFRGNDHLAYTSALQEAVKNMNAAISWKRPDFSVILNINKLTLDKIISSSELLVDLPKEYANLDLGNTELTDDDRENYQEYL